MQMDDKNYSILLKAAELFEYHSDCLEMFQMFFKNINDSETLENLAILSVFRDARTNPKIIVNQLLNVIIKHGTSELYNILKTIEDFIIQSKHNDLNKPNIFGNKEQVENTLNQSKKIIQKALLLMHDKKGQTALHVAAEKNQSEIVKIILEKAINYPQILDKIIFKLDRFLESTALHRATQLGHHKTVSTFLNFFKKLEEDKMIPNFLKKNFNHLVESSRVALARNHDEMVKVILGFLNEYLPGVIQDQIRDIDGT